MAKKTAYPTTTMEMPPYRKEYSMGHEQSYGRGEQFGLYEPDKRTPVKAAGSWGKTSYDSSGRGLETRGTRLQGGTAGRNTADDCCEREPRNKRPGRW